MIINRIVPNNSKILASSNDKINQINVNTNTNTNTNINSNNNCNCNSKSNSSNSSNGDNQYNEEKSNMNKTDIGVDVLKPQGLNSSKRVTFAQIAGCKEAKQVAIFDFSFVFKFILIDFTLSIIGCHCCILYIYCI